MEEYIVLDTLKNSTNYMNSDDWKKRFIAEYAQLVTRIDKLLDIFWEDDEEEKIETFDCPKELLSLQIDKMNDYRQILDIRAEIYGIDMNEEILKLNS